MRKYVSLLALVILVAFSTFPSYASEFIANDGTKVEVKVIDREDIPNGIIPQTFNTEEEAIFYLNNIYDNMVLMQNSIVPYSTTGDALVATRQVGYTGSINLRVNYETTGNSNTGSISYVSPYTTFTGFNLGFGWTESDIGYRISNGGKDIYVYTNGTLDYYLLVDGLVKLYSKPVNLSGTVAVIH